MSLQRGKVLLVQTWCSGPAPAAPAEAGMAPRCLTRLSGRGKGVLGLGQWAPAGLHQLPLKVTTAQETYPREPWGPGLGPIPSGQDGVPWPWLGSVPSWSPGDIVSPHPGSLFRPQHPPSSCWQNLLTAATHCPLPVGCVWSKMAACTNDKRMQGVQRPASLASMWVNSVGPA